MSFIEILKAVFFGIVEGITEWLPVSSTGHLILLNEFIKLDASDEFMEMFEVVIQLGAIMAVVILFWNKIWPFYMKKNQTVNKPGSIVKSEKDFTVGNFCLSSDAFLMWVKVVVACIPAVVYGVLFDDRVEEAFGHTMPGTDVTIKVFVVAAMLFIVGILFIMIERINKKSAEAKITTVSDITFRAAFIIGVFQLIAAALPGTSRSGATILGAIMIGVSRTAAAEFTFILGIPVMFGASLLKVVKFGGSFTGAELTILSVGTIVSFIVSVFVVKLLMDYIKKHDFQVFGWYRIVLSILVVLYFTLVR